MSDEKVLTGAQAHSLSVSCRMIRRATMEPFQQILDRYLGTICLEPAVNAWDLFGATGRGSFLEQRVNSIRVNPEHYAMDNSGGNKILSSSPRKWLRAKAFLSVFDYGVFLLEVVTIFENEDDYNLFALKLDDPPRNNPLLVGWINVLWKARMPQILDQSRYRENAIAESTPMGPGGMHIISGYQIFNASRILFAWEDEHNVLSDFMPEKVLINSSISGISMDSDIMKTKSFIVELLKYSVELSETETE